MVGLQYGCLHQSIEKKLLMAPTRKSRSVNKQFSNYTEVSLEKDDGNLNKYQQRKRKLSDMLGSQWSEEELHRFYEAYRKYGKNWRKVAGIVHNRSVEMVEALYNMNKAYLSLPEGIASVAGLIAMMTDHYNILEGSDNDQEGNGMLSQKTQKQGQGKVQFNASKENPLRSPPVAARNEGCLSLLKRRTYNGYAVGKRTPRVPVTRSLRNDDNDNCASPNKRDQKSELGDDVENVAALTLKEASQRGDMPQVSRSPFRTDHMKSSPFQGRERIELFKLKMGQTKVRSPTIDEDCLEGSMGSRGAENEDYARDIASVGTVEIYRKAKKINSKKAKFEDIGTNQFADGREAHSGIKEILYLGDANQKVDNEVTNPKIEHSSSPGRRKKNKKLFFGDESAGLDALQTLADLSLLMPTSTVESESFVRSEVEKQTVDLAHTDTAKAVGNKEKLLYGFSGLGASTSEKPKVGRERTVRVDTITEGEQQPPSSNRPRKRKRKSSSLKALAEEEVKFVIKSKRAGQNSSPSKQGESIRPVECSSISDEKRTVNDSAISNSEVAATSHASLPAKRGRRRKMDPGRIQIQKEIKSSGNNFKDQHKKYSALQDGTQYLKDKLSCCLSSSLVRRWCTFEWFYSAIDYPWFAKREFVDYLNHVGLGHIPRLTRVEWGVIRSSLGKPRRFSEHFLMEEKEKLKQYRESVRKHYAELRAGIREGLPTDLACPLAVGQRVIALHQKSKEVHDGSVLTVDHDKCRIQFDRPELGVEFVMDIDCMPVNLLENMPEASWRQKIGVDREPKDGKSSTGGLVVFSPNGHQENVCSPICTLVKREKGDTVNTISQPKAAAIDTVNTPEADYYHPYMVGHSYARGRADVGALTELTHALDKKEAVMAELKHANDEVLRSECNGESLLKDSELFKKQYEMVSSALLNLRQCNTYPGNSLFPWLKPSATTIGFNGTPSSIDHLSTNYRESGSNILGIVKDSRLKAHKMVDVAVQAMSSVKEGEDAFERIGEALNSSDKQKLRADHGSATAKSPEQVNGGTLHQLGSELITSCVASLLMVQTCTERQYPPADMAQILDSAVTSLHPHCPQNIPIYREIQKCMGRIKTQILALVPS